MRKAMVLVTAVWVWSLWDASHRERSAWLALQASSAEPMPTSSRPASVAAAALAREVAPKGWVVFSGPTEGGDWDLFVMRPDGSQLKRLTRTADTIEAGARFSPDGKKLLYYRIPKAEGLDNNKYGTYELVIANSDGSGAIAWGKGFHWACWGGKSDQIACLGPSEIHIYDLVSRRKVRTIAAKGLVEQLTWSPDGKSFSATANGLGQYWNIAGVDAQGGQVRAMGEGERYNCTSDWMGDSSGVVYARGIIPEKGGWAQLWFAPASGKDRRMLYAETGRHTYGGCSSPDGKYLLMTRSVEDLGTAGPKITMALIRLSDTPMLGSSDKALASQYPSAKPGPRLDLPSGWEPHWTYAEISFAESVAPATGATGAPAATAPAETRVEELKREVHDNGWIVHGARTGKGDWDLFMMRPDGRENRNITNTPEHSEFLPRPSPDGDRLMYRRVKKADTLDNNRHGAQGELVIANIDASKPDVIGKDGEYAWASWGPDGKVICCLSPKEISFVELAGRKVARQIPRQGFYQQLILSPDGRWLCGVSNAFGAEWRVGRIEVPTGKANAVSDGDCCTPDWFPDNSHIVFSCRPPNQEGSQYGWTQLWMADGDGRNRRLVYGEDGRHVYGGLISPDGKYVVFTGNKEEDGNPGHDGAPMGLMRFSDAPTIGGASKALRKVHPNTKDGPVLKLPSGFEPCWIGPGAKMPATSEAR